MPDELAGDREPVQVLRDMQRKIDTLESQLTDLIDRTTMTNIRPGAGGGGTLIEKAEITGLVANRNEVGSAAFAARRLSNQETITVEVYSAPETDGIDLNFAYPRFRTGDEIAIYEDSGGVFWAVHAVGETCSTA